MVAELETRIDFVPAEEFVIEDLDTLKVLADPLRLRIRELMEKPTTVKIVAEKLDMLPTKLYYHINLLEKHGLIVLVDTRIVSGIIEKHYQIAAKSVKVAGHLLSTGDDPETGGLNLAVTGILDSAREELLESVRSGIVKFDEDGERHNTLSIQMGIVNLTDDQAEAFYKDVESVFERYQKLSHEENDEKRDQLKSYRTLYMLFPQLVHTSDDEG